MNISPSLSARTIVAGAAILLMILPSSGVMAQESLTVYRDSASFADAGGRLRYVDFEDLYSIASNRITLRNPLYILVGDFVDSSDGNRRHNYVGMDYGGTIDLPARTRRVRIDDYVRPEEGRQPVIVEITDFNGISSRLPVASTPLDISSDEGIQRIRLYGADYAGNDEVNWWMDISSVEAFDKGNELIARFDFDTLEPYTQYVLSTPHGVYDHAESIGLHGITLHDKLGVEDYYYPLGEQARVDPDNGSGNIAVRLAPGGAIEFPEGTEGAMVVVEPFYSDSVTFTATDYAGASVTVGDLGCADGIAWFGFRSPAGIRSIEVASALYDRASLSAVIVGEFPQTEIAAISSSVAQMGSYHALASDQQSRLQSSLGMAHDAVLLGDRTTAIVGLEKFIEDVDALHAGGVLVPEERNSLVGSGRYEIERLSKRTSHLPAPASIVSHGVSLDAAWPDPARGEISIGYRLEAPASVALEITDQLGRLVRRIESESMAAGEHLLRWDRRDAAGARVADGVYFYTLRAGGARITRAVRVRE